MKNENMTDRQKAMADFLGVVLGMIAGVLLFMLTSCKSHERIIEVRTTDTLRMVSLKYDSIYKHDSIYVREYMRGDTVYVDKDRWHTLYKDKLRIDTLYVSKKEYIRYTVKEKQPWYKEMMMHYSAYVIVLLLALIFALLMYIKFIHKRNTHEQEARNT